MDLGRITHLFLVVSEFPFPLLGRDLLTNMRSQLHFSSEGAKVLGSEGKPIHVLTTTLAETYWMFDPLSTSENEITTWLDHLSMLGQIKEELDWLKMVPQFGHQ